MKRYHKDGMSFFSRWEEEVSLMTESKFASVEIIAISDK